jgi:hypothetical protein
MATEHVRINIETGNDAFAESPTGEIARILRALADEFEQYGLPDHALHDINGNYCGEVVITESDEEEE